LAERHINSLQDYIAEHASGKRADGHVGRIVNFCNGLSTFPLRGNAARRSFIRIAWYGAGPNQDINNPLGVGGTELHQWLVPTRTFQRALFGKDGGTTGVDDDFAARGFQNVGAWILGRNLFGPIRGDWPDTNWKGWWGDNPPYHVPVFILTHHARPPIEMEGDTTFHFITGGIREALDRAREAAAGMDVRIGGGADTIQQYLTGCSSSHRSRAASRAPKETLPPLPWPHILETSFEEHGRLPKGDDSFLTSLPVQLQTRCGVEFFLIAPHGSDFGQPGSTVIHGEQ
jgi:dihydrofolate reductase